MAQNFPNPDCLYVEKKSFLKFAQMSHRLAFKLVIVSLKAIWKLSLTHISLLYIVIFLFIYSSSTTSEIVVPSGNDEDFLDLTMPKNFMPKDLAAL
jgi:hypothetical protein